MRFSLSFGLVLTFCGFVFFGMFPLVDDAERGSWGHLPAGTATSHHSLSHLGPQDPGQGGMHSSVLPCAAHQLWNFQARVGTTPYSTVSWRDGVRGVWSAGSVPLPV